jgi:hypothetical protein
MKKKLLIMLLASTIVLSGCMGAGGLFEARVYGVRQSEWEYMSARDRLLAQRDYEHSVILERQRVQHELAQQAQDRARIREEGLRAEQSQRQLEEQYHYANNAREAADLAEAKRRSMATYRQDQARRELEEANQRSLNHRQEQERRDVEEARRRSMATHRQEQEKRDLEEARRRSLETRQQQERRDIEAAKRRSMETYRQEQQREQRDVEEAKRRSMDTYRQEQANRAHSSASASTEPNEGELVRGGAIIMDLQRSLGRKPTVSEMQSKLSSSMGVTSAKAGKIIEGLDLY